MNEVVERNIRREIGNDIDGFIELETGREIENDMDASIEHICNLG